MKKHLFLGVVLLLAFKWASANSVVGGNLKYECNPAGEYQFVLTVYAYCFGLETAEATQNIFLEDDCGSFPTSIELQFESEIEISDLCAPELPNSSCSDTGALPGIKKIIYRSGNFTALAPGCNYDITWANKNWFLFSNRDPVELTLAVFATRISPTGTCTPLPTVNSLEVPYVCIGDPLSHQITFNNPNGYTIDYNYTDLLTAGNVNTAGYNPAVPVPGITQVDGLVEFNATTVGVSVVALDLEFFDGATSLGGYTEYFPVVTRDCDFSTSEFMPMGVDSIGAGVIEIAPTEVNICLGDTLFVRMSAENSNPFRVIEMASDVEAVFGPGSYTTSGTNPVQGIIEVVPDETHLGTHNFLFELSDDNCINPAVATQALTVNVFNSLTVDQTEYDLCLGDTFTPQANGDVNYEWTVLSGDDDLLPSCSNCGSPTFTPDLPTIIEVVGTNITGGCVDRDTITVDVSLAQFNAVIVNETCAQNDASIDISLTSGSGNFDYLWTPGAIPTQDLANIDSGIYTLSVTDVTLGCMRDTIIEISTVPAPTASLSPDVTICEGESTDIVVTLGGIGPFDVDFTNLPDATGVVDQQVFSVTPATTTTYTLNSSTDANMPACTYSTPDQITVTVRPTVVASFQNPATICADGLENLVIDINQPGQFDLTYTTDGMNPINLSDVMNGESFSVDPNVDTDYAITSVAYTDAPLCANTTLQTVTLTVNPLPTIVVTGETAICAGETLDLELAFTGTAPWEVNYTLNGVIGQINVAASPFDWSLMTGASGQVCITSIEDSATPNCSEDFMDLCHDYVVNPLPTVDFAAAALAFCTGDSVQMTLENFTGGLDYDFQIALDGTPIITETANTADPYVFFANMPGQYTVIDFETSTTCANAVATTIDIVENLLPTMASEIAQTTCEGIAVNWEVTPAGTAPWTLEYTYSNGINPDEIRTEAGILVAPHNIAVADSGSYVLNTIVDGNGCANDQFANDFELTVFPLPTLTPVLADYSICAGDAANVQATWEGTGPIDVTYDVGGIVDNILAFNGDTISFAVAQDAIITFTQIEDQNCPATINETINVSEQMLPVADAGVDQTLCEAVDFTTGGAALAGYEYQWSVAGFPALVSMASEISFPTELGMSAVSPIAVTVQTTANGCTNTDEMLLTVLAAPAADAGPDSNECLGADFTLAGAGGANYQWEANPAFVGPTNVAAPTVNIDTYAAEGYEFVLTAEGANGCFYNDTVRIAVNMPTLLDITANDSLCVDATNGSIDIVVNGGWGFDQINWIPNTLAGLSVDNLAPGTYDFSILDIENCETTGSVEIIELPIYVFEDFQALNPTCPDLATGQVLFTNTDTQTIMLDNTQISEAELVALPEGTYDISISNIYGCMVDTMITLVDPTPITINTPQDAFVSCIGEELIIEMAAMGGTGLLLYNWENANGDIIDQEINGMLDFAPDADQSIFGYVTDEEGCVSATTIEFTFDVAEALVLSSTSPSAFGQCDNVPLTIDVLSSNGNNGVDFNWVDNLTGFQYLGASLSLDVIADMQLEVFADDGCSVSAPLTFDITVLNAPEANISTDNEIGCFPYEADFMNLSTYDPGATCAWNMGDGNLVSDCNDFSYTFQNQGFFWVSYVVTNPNGCVDSTQTQSGITVTPYPEIGFEFFNAPLNSLDNEVIVENTSQEGLVPFWFTNTGETSTETEIAALPIAPGISEIQVCLRLQQVSNCTDTLCKTVNIENLPLIYVPSAFTPDGDGLNEFFTPVISGVDFSTYKFLIFDRWGEVVFETNNHLVGWKGENVSGETNGAYYVTNNVYNWRIEVAETLESEVIVRTGTVTILR